MKRTIIVEGPDGAGKSHLVRDLAYVFHREAQHTGGSARTMGELEERLHRVEVAPGGRFIFDRCPHISDGIYKRALGLPLILPPRDLAFRLLVETRPAPILIYCRRDDPKSMKDSISRVQKDHKPPEYTEKVLQSFDKVLKGYDEWFGRLPPRGYLTYDWATDTLSDLVSRITQIEGAD